MGIDDLDDFTRAYAVAALWSSIDDNGPLDDSHDIDDIAPETMAAMIADCKKFQTDNAADLALAIDAYAVTDESSGESYAGHDFWLTRNGHGAGFWDGDLPDDLGDRLTEAANKFPEVDLYVGDDGRIHA